VGTCDIAVYNDLLVLKDELPDLFAEMKGHFSKRPFMRITGKYFTMQQYYAWEYRLNLKKRVYLQVHSAKRRVYIYGAGAHPKEKVPKPPKAENIVWSKFMAI
jgi:hypothetical protein